MPTATSTKRKPAKRPAAKRERKFGERKTPMRLTPAHKKALAQGRSLSAAVDRYLKALNTPRKRGRKVSPAALRARLDAARKRKQSTRGVDLVIASQEVRDLERRLTAEQRNGHGDLRLLEAAFVRAARPYSEAHGITYAAWRDAKVPAKVLTKAGIARTRTKVGSDA